MNKYGQFDIFDYVSEPVTITKPIRLIELFAGYGSQAMALKRIGAKFEHYRVVEFDKYAIASYNAVHGTDFPTMDITKVHAEDLNICDTETFTYLLTYSFPCTDLSVAGKQAGMSKGSGTRSGLLWEVERIFRKLKIPAENYHRFYSWKMFRRFMGKRTWRTSRSGYSSLKALDIRISGRI